MWGPVLHPPSALPRPIGFNNQLVWPNHPAKIMVLAKEEASTVLWSTARSVRVTWGRLCLFVYLPGGWLRRIAMSFRSAWSTEKKRRRRREGGGGEEEERREGGDAQVTNLTCFRIFLYISRTKQSIPFWTDYFLIWNVGSLVPLISLWESFVRHSPGKRPY